MRAARAASAMPREAAGASISAKGRALRATIVSPRPRRAPGRRRSSSRMRHPEELDVTGRGDGILAGIRVIEICTGIPGPVAGMLLAEAGADVIKVEPPRGDPMRVSPGFHTWNRSKRGIAL